MFSLLLLPWFLIFSISWLRVSLFVQVFKMKSACNLILLGRSIICKFLLLLLSSLFFAALHLVVYMYIYTHTHTHKHTRMYIHVGTHTRAHMYIRVGTRTHRGKSHQSVFISQILFLKDLKRDELVSAAHCFKLTVIAFIFFSPSAPI